MIFAVIDTHVIVAALLTKNHDSPTARVMRAVFAGDVVPLLMVIFLMNIEMCFIVLVFNLIENSVIRQFRS